FFFQAEDGIRDFHVTGVQTCALPILLASRCLVRKLRETGPLVLPGRGVSEVRGLVVGSVIERIRYAVLFSHHKDDDHVVVPQRRSEERRVGKGCRSRWGTEVDK